MAGFSITRRQGFLSMAVLLLLTLSSAQAGQSQEAPDAEQAQKSLGSGFEIRWQTISAGGGSASSTSYQLRGTIGQHAASPDHPATSTNYSHTGGFWAILMGSGEAVVDLIFRDRFRE